MKDLLIIGAGPGGLAAGIYGARAQLDCVIIEKNSMAGGQIINTYEVDNYPGLPGVTGMELAEKFRDHCIKAGVSFLEGEVSDFAVEGDLKRVVVGDQVLEAKAVIIATGAVNRKLGVPGEDTFTGRGVSYCATCDGAFFRGKTVAVVGGGNVAVEDAIFLGRICKKVYVIHRREELRADKTLATALLAMEHGEMCWNTTVKEIRGTQKVEEIVLEEKGGTSRVLRVDGVFVAVGTSPNSQVFAESVPVDDKGYLIAGEDCKTAVPGVYAVGDVRKKALKQVLTAAADGANAITAVEQYLMGK